MYPWYNVPLNQEPEMTRTVPMEPVSRQEVHALMSKIASDFNVLGEKFARTHNSAEAMASTFRNAMDAVLALGERVLELDRRIAALERDKGDAN
jgi:hypothetical protein